MKFIDFVVSRPCFICGKKILCDHRERDIIIAEGQIVRASFCKRPGTSQETTGDGPGEKGTGLPARRGPGRALAQLIEGDELLSPSSSIESMKNR